MEKESPPGYQPSEGRDSLQTLQIDLLICNRVVSRYAIAIDTKDFDALGNIFASNAEVDFTAVRPDIGIINDRMILIKTLQQALEGKDTHHALTTQLIDSITPDECRMRTYFTNNTFSKDTPRKYLHTTQHGYYSDVLRPDGKGGWHIVLRRIIALGPSIVIQSTPTAAAGLKPAVLGMD